MMADMPPGVRRLLLMTAAITGEIPEELKVLAGADIAWNVVCRLAARLDHGA